MKSPHLPVRASVLLAASLVTLALSACGQKGPLYMPKVPPDPLASTAPKTATPAPAATPDAAPKPGSSSQ